MIIRQKMLVRFATVGAVAVILFATGVVHLYSQEIGCDPPDTVQYDVLVAERDLEPGDRFDTTNVRVEQVPLQYLPASPVFADELLIADCYVAIEELGADEMIMGDELKAIDGCKGPVVTSTDEEIR